MQNKAKLIKIVFKKISIIYFFAIIFALEIFIQHNNPQIVSASHCPDVLGRRCHQDQSLCHPIGGTRRPADGNCHDVNICRGNEITCPGGALAGQYDQFTYYQCAERTITLDEPDGCVDWQNTQGGGNCCPACNTPGTWSGWGTCSATCGPGTQTRTCNTAPCGLACPNDGDDGIRDCNNGSCCTYRTITPGTCASPSTVACNQAIYKTDTCVAGSCDNCNGYPLTTQCGVGTQCGANQTCQGPTPTCVPNSTIAGQKVQLTAGGDLSQLDSIPVNILPTPVPNPPGSPPIPGNGPLEQIRLTLQNFAGGRLGTAYVFPAYGNVNHELTIPEQYLGFPFWIGYQCSGFAGCIPNVTNFPPTYVPSGVSGVLGKYKVNITTVPGATSFLNWTFTYLPGPNPTALCAPDAQSVTIGWTPVSGADSHVVRINKFPFSDWGTEWNLGDIWSGPPNYSGSQPPVNANGQPPRFFQVTPNRDYQASVQSIHGTDYSNPAGRGGISAQTAFNCFAGPSCTIQPNLLTSGVTDLEPSTPEVDILVDGTTNIPFIVSGTNFTRVDSYQAPIALGSPYPSPLVLPSPWVNLTSGQAEFNNDSGTIRRYVPKDGLPHYFDVVCNATNDQATYQGISVIYSCSGNTLGYYPPPSPGLTAPSWSNCDPTIANPAGGTFSDSFRVKACSCPASPRCGQCSGRCPDDDNVSNPAQGLLPINGQVPLEPNGKVTLSWNKANGDTASNYTYKLFVCPKTGTTVGPIDVTMDVRCGSTNWIDVSTGITQSGNAYSYLLTPATSHYYWKVVSQNNICQPLIAPVPTTVYAYFNIPTAFSWWQSQNGLVYAGASSGESVRSYIPSINQDSSIFGTFQCTTLANCTPFSSLQMPTGTFYTSGITMSGGGQIDTTASSSQYDNLRNEVTTPITAYPVQSQRVPNTTVPREDYAYFATLLNLPSDSIDDFSKYHNGESAPQPGEIGKLDPVAPSKDAELDPGGELVLGATNANYYYSAGDLSLGQVGGDLGWIVPATEKIIVFVHGNLKVNNTTTVEPGGFLMFIVDGDITFDSSLGNSVLTNTTANVAGVYIADGTISFPEAAPLENKKFIAEGTYVGWAGDSSGQGIYLGRNYLTDLLNATNPTEVFRFRPDFLINAPDSIKRPMRLWQETN